MQRERERLRATLTAIGRYAREHAGWARTFEDDRAVEVINHIAELAESGLAEKRES